MFANVTFKVDHSDQKAWTGEAAQDRKQVKSEHKGFGFRLEQSTGSQNHENIVDDSSNEVSI